MKHHIYQVNNLQKANWDCQITNISIGPIKRLKVIYKQMVIVCSSYFVLVYGFNEMVIYLKPLIIKKYYKYP